MRKAKTKKKARLAWSKNEVKLIKRLYPRGKASEIAKRTGRSFAAVKQKAHRMGIKTREDHLWSAGEIRQLKRLYPSETAQSIADKLGRSYEAVTVKARKLGICGQSNVWSKRELYLLKRLYPSKTALFRTEGRQLAYFQSSGACRAILLTMLLRLRSRQGLSPRCPLWLKSLTG